MRPIVMGFFLALAGTADQCDRHAAYRHIPAETDLQVRIESRVASNVSRPDEPVAALVIAPVTDGDRVLLPAGARLLGKIMRSQSRDQEHERALLGLEFNAVEGRDAKSIPVASRVTEVDNARESVDDTGTIQGILPSEALTTRLDEAIARLEKRYQGLAAVLLGAKRAFVKEAQVEIDYPAGTEMVVRLTGPLVLIEKLDEAQAVHPFAAKAELSFLELVNSQPFQTTAENPPKPSDITNLMLLGTQPQIEEAFKLAGWSTAAELNAESKMETVRAVLEARGYSEAPVSILLLEGRKPDLVFQKQLNTFAKRHHLRIWRRPDEYQGRPVWVVAATHDIDIEFSPENRNFIHKIDSNIDKERAKVAYDLLLTGRIERAFLVDRPDVPKESKNATGDALRTDARMAVLLMR